MSELHNVLCVNKMKISKREEVTSITDTGTAERMKPLKPNREA